MKYVLCPITLSCANILLYRVTFATWSDFGIVAYLKVFQWLKRHILVAFFWRKKGLGIMITTASSLSPLLSALWFLSACKYLRLAITAEYLDSQVVQLFVSIYFDRMCMFNILNKCSILNWCLSQALHIEFHTSIALKFFWHTELVVLTFAF